MTKFPKSEKYNFARTLVKKHKLVPYLDKYLSKEVEGLEFRLDPKVGDDAWHPSGHCTPSVDALFAIATGTAESRNWGSLHKSFAVGHFWHQLLQKAVVDLDLAEESSIERRGYKGWGEAPRVLGAAPWFPYHWATGSGDVAPLVLPKHGEYVIDFKTMSGQQFRQESLPEWAADKYEAQINIYMDFFDIDKGIIVAICKDSPHDMKEFEFVRNQELIDAIYEKWIFVSDCLDGNSVIDEDAIRYYTLDDLFMGPITQ